MAEEQKSAPEASTLKKRLLARIGVAGAVIVALLATLALFETYTHEEEPAPSAPAPIAPPPAPEAQPAPPPAPEKPAEAPAEEKKAPEPVAEPERTAQPVGPQRPVEPHREAPKTTEPAAPKTTEAPPPVAKKVEERPRPALAPAIEAAKPASGAPAGYVVQLGVFTNVTNAEELRAKLTLNSIPSQLETRVLAGPFKTKQEAEAAQAKLKALGLDAGMLIPFPARK